MSKAHQPVGPGLNSTSAFRRYITKGHENLQVVDGDDQGAMKLNEQIQRLLEIILNVYVVSN